MTFFSIQSCWDEFALRKGSAYLCCKLHKCTLCFLVVEACCHTSRWNELVNHFGISTAFQEEDCWWLLTCAVYFVSIAPSPSLHPFSRICAYMCMKRIHVKALLGWNSSRLDCAESLWEQTQYDFYWMLLGKTSTAGWCLKAIFSRMYPLIVDAMFNVMLTVTRKYNSQRPPVPALIHRLVSAGTEEETDHLSQWKPQWKAMSNSLSNAMAEPWKAPLLEKFDFN